MPWDAALLDQDADDAALRRRIEELDQRAARLELQLGMVAQRLEQAARRLAKVDQRLSDRR